MSQLTSQSNTPRIEHVGLVNKEGQWFSRVGLSEGSAVSGNIVESGYTCRDGVWYKCLSLSSTR